MSNGKFRRFCIMKPGAGNIDRFCSKLSQSNLKWLVKIPYEHKYHTKYRSVSRSGHGGHERSPNSKILSRAGCLWFIFTFARIIQKSKPFCNLTPCKSTTEKGQVNLVSHKVKFSKWHLQMCAFLNQCYRRIPKMSFFISAPRLEMLKIAVRKNGVINGYGF